MSKNKILIIIIIVVVCVGTVVCFYSIRSKSSGNVLGAGLWDVIGNIFSGASKGMNCAGKIAKCYQDEENCKRRVNEEKERCSSGYDKDINRCNKYYASSELFLPKCSTNNNTCQAKAETKKQRDLLRCTSGDTACQAKAEARKQDSLLKCAENYASCQIKAQERKDLYIQRAQSCIQRANEKKDKCQNYQNEREAREIASCLSKGQRCLNNLIKSCGSLVP